MPTEPSNRTYALVMGALVADAAALGFHWLYDQKRIDDVAPQSPQFHPINQADYDGVPGYFAHAARRAGDLSQYGEQLWTMMQSLARSGGHYAQSDYERSFREHFGYGGGYVGYIDRPTRDTLDNITRAEINLLNQARDLPFEGTDQDRNALMSKVKAYSQALSGNELRQRVESAVRQTHNQTAMVEHAFALCDLVEKMTGVHGADDQQLPALSKLPALIAVSTDDDHCLTQVESAVRVTNNNDTAVHYAKATAVLLKQLSNGASLDTAIAACKAASHDAIAQSFDKVDAAAGQSINEAVKQFGMACDLDYAFPSILFILKNSTSYRDAVVANIYAGGDSCGRAITIGAAMGALHVGAESRGLPLDWIKRLNNAEPLHALTRDLAKLR